MEKILEECLVSRGALEDFYACPSSLFKLPAPPQLWNL